MLAALLLQAAPVTALPASLKPGALEACAPTTLAAAEDCLRKSVSADDLTILLDRIASRRFAPELECEIETAWRLVDPVAPMAKVMDGLLGFHHPAMAAEMIIADLQVRAVDPDGFPFGAFREMVRRPPGSTSTCRKPNS